MIEVVKKQAEAVKKLLRPSRLLAHSGARRQATFFTKFDKTVVVDFNEKVEAHLKALYERRGKASNRVFPRPRDTKGPGFSPTHKSWRTGFGLTPKCRGSTSTTSGTSLSAIV
jgi:hypothetical protein